MQIVHSICSNAVNSPLAINPGKLGVSDTCTWQTPVDHSQLKWFGTSHVGAITRLHIHGGGMGTYFLILSGIKVLVLATSPIVLDQNGLIDDKRMTFERIQAREGMSG